MQLQRILDSIITRAKNRGRVIDQYQERHHIIPVSLGGTNHRDNLVWLFPEEHYVVHHLLWRIRPLNSSLRKAWTGMNNMAKNKNLFKDLRIKNQTTMRSLSKTEEFAQRRKRATQAAKTQEALAKRASSFKGFKHTEQAKVNMSNSRKGKPHSLKHKINLAESTKIRMNTSEEKERYSQKWKENNPLKEVAPWNHPVAIKTGRYMQWKFAGLFYDWWVANGSDMKTNRCTKMLKELNVDCTRGTAQTCIFKFQKGWNPYNDAEWTKFTGK